MMDALGSMFGAQGVSPGVSNLMAMIRARQASGAQMQPGPSGSGAFNGVGGMMSGAMSGATPGAMPMPATAPMQSGVTGVAGRVGQMMIPSRVSALANLIRAGRMRAGGGAPAAPPTNLGYSVA